MKVSSISKSESCRDSDPPKLLNETIYSEMLSNVQK